MYQQIWNGILDTDRMIRYYGMLSDKLRFRHQVASVVLAAIACGAAVPLLTQLPNYLAAVMFFLVAVATIWLLKADYSSKSTAASIFAAQYGYLAIEWRGLWFGQPSQQQIDALWEKYHRIAGGYDIPEDTKLNWKAMYESDLVLTSEFGSGNSQESVPAGTSSA